MRPPKQPVTKSHPPSKVMQPDDSNARHRQLAEFLRTSAHEMRAPLQTIYGFARLLRSGLSPAEFEHYVSLIQQDTDRLMAMVEDLGWRGQLAQADLTVRPVVCHIEPLLVTLSQEVERAYSDRYVELIYTSVPPIYAEPNRLRDILQILLRNAAQYSGPGCQPIRLRVRSLPGSGQLEITVRDGGVGIPVRYGERIFQPAPNLPRSLGRPRTGLGLGLYVARELAWQMKGDLWLRGSLPVKGRGQKRLYGNEYVLRLPLAPEVITHE